MNLQYSLAYNYGLEYLNDNKKLTKEKQQEVKYFMLKEIVEYYCYKYQEERDNYNEKECIRISKKIDRLSKISIFNKVDYRYYKNFILEIKTFQYHKCFDTGIENYKDDLFNSLEISRYLNSL